MRFDEFLTQYKQAHSDWTFGRVRTADAANEIARLRAEVPSIEPPEKRSTAEFSLNQFEAEISPAAQDRMARAVAAVSEATADGGSVDERIARAENGLTAVTLIARESANQSEQHAILSMNESLMTVIDTLRTVTPRE